MSRNSGSNGNEEKSCHIHTEKKVASEKDEKLVVIQRIKHELRRNKKKALPPMKGKKHKNIQH